MKYEKWLKEWVNNYIKPTTKERTYNRYFEIINNHIVPKLGEYDLNDLTPIILQKHITYLLNNGNLINGKGLSSSSINTIITVIQESLNTAYKIGLVNFYNADKIKRPKKVEKKVTCFTPYEQKKIETIIISGGNYKLYGILLCLYLGLRIGELLSLTWDDIDLKRLEVSINKTCYDSKDKNNKYCRKVTSPKTESSSRIIPLPKQLLPIIKEIKNNSKSEFVISDNDRVITIRSYQKTFDSLLKKLNIEHKGFHALRHTFATRALECGMDVKTLSEILGHKSPSITLSRYAHSLMEHKKEMMNKIGKLLL